MLRISAYMQVRGPDGEGDWLSEDARVGLAHRRLSIIDLSEAAAQPMQSADGKLAITYNGEIYNYQTLREQLQIKGYTFQSGSDTEVLLHLYHDQGKAMVNSLRGMFAFAIWDTRTSSLFLARDSYGIKPLYYADDGATIRVASQVKALLAGGQVSREQDPAGIVGFYLLGSVPEPYTCYKAIRALPAGHTLTVSAAGVGEPRAYSSITGAWEQAEAQPEAQFETGKDIQQAIRQALLDSVRHHLVADVPVAVFLSAGVDSGAILGLMRELHPEAEIQAITLAFEEFTGSANDEFPLAEEVAQQYGATHTRRVVSREEFQNELPKILEAMDQPSIDGINTWFVAKAANELGVKVALSGLGGDELFGGYPAFEDVPRWVRQFGLLSKVPLLGSALRWAISTLPLPGLSPKAAGLPKYGGSFAGAWLLRRGIYMPWEINKLMPMEQAEQGLQKLNIMAMINSVIGNKLKGAFPRVATMEASLYMRNQLLRDADWAGMAHSVEIRVPLVDASLLERLAPQLLASEQIDGKRWLGNSPSDPLPEKIINRPKTGFTTPIREWQQHITASDTRGLPGEANREAREHWSRGWARKVANHQGIAA